MLLDKYYLFGAFLVVTLSINLTAASICGSSICHENSECKFFPENSKLDCVCKERYMKTTTENHVYCCSKQGENCAVNRKCNINLECLEIDVLKTERNKMLDELLSCPETKKCQEACCAENEICSVSEKKCVSKDNPDAKLAEINMNDLENREQLDELHICPESKKCEEACCAENEICSVSEKKCTPEDNSEAQEPQAIILNQPVGEINKALDESLSCPDTKKCLEACCAENERCSELEKKCVPEATNSDAQETVVNKTNANKLNAENIEELDETLGCIEAKKCQEECCFENEICSVSEKKCIPINNSENIAFDSEKTKELNVRTICNESRMCEEECCSENEICSVSEKKCVPGIYTEANEPTESIVKHLTTTDPELTAATEEYFTETTASSKQSTTTVSDKLTQATSTDESTITVVNCPHQQKCNNKCCSSHQLCNKLNECVNNDVGDVWDLFDFSQQEIANADIKAILTCPSDQQLCQDTCCSAQQICNDVWQCVAKTNACSDGQNCVQSLEVNTGKAGLAYTIIGAGILVAALAFAVFKLYDIRRSKRNLY